MNRGFTCKSAGGVLRTLRTTCHISQAFDPADGVPEFTRTEVNAVWDTGAAISVITQRVVDACSLKSVRPGVIKGVHGVQETELYLANIYLPNKVAFFELTVARGNPPDDWWDMLIGMDIISAGDFSIKNVNSNTEWSFSYPLHQLPSNTP